MTSERNKAKRRKNSFQMTTTTIDDESEAGVARGGGWSAVYRRSAVAGVPSPHYGRRAEERSNEAFV